MAKLFNYRDPRRAKKTLAKLRAKWPANRFEVELSGSLTYAFKYVIACIMPDGRKAYVERVKF